MVKEINKQTFLDRFLKTAIVVLIILLASVVQVHAAAPFSFIVVGDTRTEPYLTGGTSQEGALKTILQERYHNKPVRLFFDPKGLELQRVEIEEDKDSTLSLYYHDGWPRSIVRTGKDGVSRVIMRDAGRKWVFDRIVSAFRKGEQNQEGGALFLVHGGDIPLFGYQGMSLDESPYWQLFDKELLSRLPLPDKNLGLPGRVLAAVGNHEIWEDKDLRGMLTAMPWLKKLGLSKGRRIYSVPFRNCRFIFLDSGGYNTPEDWNSRFPGFEDQMAYLTKELNMAKESGADHAFVVYHKPSFVKVGHDPLHEEWNLHKYTKQFARDLNIIVLNSHTHTTEHYVVDGIGYLVLGGGGAPQNFDLTSNPSLQKELYWKGEDRVEEYNYLQIEVNGTHITGVIHRFRPTEPQNPMSTVEVFKK
jgi:hypothetical protein